MKTMSGGLDGDLGSSLRCRPAVSFLRNYNVKKDAS